jgi:hypothetical protein
MPRGSRHEDPQPDGPLGGALAPQLGIQRLLVQTQMPQFPRKQTLDPLDLDTQPTLVGLKNPIVLIEAIDDITRSLPLSSRGGRSSIPPEMHFGQSIKDRRPNDVVTLHGFRLLHFQRPVVDARRHACAFQGSILMPRP